MPQKLNKAGQMQDYIPKGNGDASGEYGTSNGTNKNFTTSDKKKTEANVITENKSVVVGDIDETYTDERYLTPDEWEQVYNLSKKVNKKMDDLVDELYDYQDKTRKGTKNAIKDLEAKYNKANIIDSDLTGKGKAKEINDFSKVFDNDDLTITFENDKYSYAKSGKDGMKKNQFLETLGATVSNKKQRERLATRNDGKWTFNVKNNKTGETKAITLNNDELFSLWNKVKNKGDLEKKGNNYFSVSFQKERQERNKKDFEDYD